MCVSGGKVFYFFMSEDQKTHTIKFATLDHYFRISGFP